MAIPLIPVDNRRVEWGTPVESMTSQDEPLKLLPEVLMHPNIPKPLHGINPRSIKGPNWWNKIRQEVYASTGYRCIACGVFKLEAKGPKWLEAHEYWDIDYETGICEIIKLIPLCHYCHNFIHSGRLLMILQEGKIKEEEAIAILEHGFEILKNNKLKCFYNTLEIANGLGAETFNVKAAKIKVNENVKWGDWQLVFEGKSYRSQFVDEIAWGDYY